MSANRCGGTVVNKLEEPRTKNRPKNEHGAAPWMVHFGAAAFKSGSNSVSAPAQNSRVANEQLDALRRDRDALWREISEAAQVQRRLSTPCQLRRGSFDIAGEIFPARHLSGDFLAAFDAGFHTVLGLGDIAGKGLSAGMWFTHLVGLVRVFAGSLADPAEVAARINGHLAETRPEAPTTTLFLIRADAQTGEFVYCNAGHPAPLVLRRDGAVERLGPGGPLLGAIPDADFVNGRTILNPGDTLLAYSDGIVECRNKRGEEFGMERLVEATRSAVGPADAMLFSVLGATQDFAAGEPRLDDIALMVVHRLAGS
jgi:sigma-B regulation protein RsbU (phosphoserine phosphatase)